MRTSARSRRERRQREASSRRAACRRARSRGAPPRTAATWGSMESFEETSQLPHQGLTPIVFSSTAQAGGPPAVTVSRIVRPARRHRGRRADDPEARRLLTPLASFGQEPQRTQRPPRRRVSVSPPLALCVLCASAVRKPSSPSRRRPEPAVRRPEPPLRRPEPPLRRLGAAAASVGVGAPSVEPTQRRPEPTPGSSRAAAASRRSRRSVGRSRRPVGRGRRSVGRGRRSVDRDRRSVSRSRRSGGTRARVASPRNLASWPARREYSSYMLVRGALAVAAAAGRPARLGARAAPGRRPTRPATTCVVRVDSARRRAGRARGPRGTSSAGRSSRSTSSTSTRRP